jgi:predicted phosphodiesterase
MARLAIISDIHGNLHALQAVLARLKRMRIRQLVCLGDIVGYGPFPGPCLDLVMERCQVIVRGNHDEAVLNLRLADDFNGPARQAIEWTRARFGSAHLNTLRSLRPMQQIRNVVTCVHDSPVPGPTDYIHDVGMAAPAFRGFHTPICLLGHTHVPAVFEVTAESSHRRVEPEHITRHEPRDGLVVKLHKGCRYICNPGSVGQPRDYDPRASFAVLDVEKGTFAVHREAYDVTAAQHATQLAGLPTILADRLALGA